MCSSRASLQTRLRAPPPHFCNCITFPMLCVSWDPDAFAAPEPTGAAPGDCLSPPVFFPHFPALPLDGPPSPASRGWLAGLPHPGLFKSGRTAHIPYPWSHVWAPSLRLVLNPWHLPPALSTCLPRRGACSCSLPLFQVLVASMVSGLTRALFSWHSIL